MNRYLLFLVTSFVIATGIAKGQPLEGGQDVHGWSKAVWGSSRQQIKGIFAEAIALAEDQRVTPPNVLCDLGLKDFKILDTTRSNNYLTFDVNFCFASKGELNQVMLVRQFRIPKDKIDLALEGLLDETQKEFTATGTMLIEKYGAPTFRDDTEDIRRFLGRTVHLPMRTRLWKFPSSVITLRMDCHLPIRFRLPICDHRPMTAFSRNVLTRDRSRSA